MRKIVLIPLIIIIIGLCLALAGFAAGGLAGFWYDRHGIHLANAERGKLIEVDETYKSYKNIDVKVDYISRITLKEGDSYSVRGENYERYGGLSARLRGDTLEIDVKAPKKWFVTMIADEFWNADNTYLEITYPKGAKLGTVSVDISTSKVRISGLNSDSLSIYDNFGDVDVSAVNCGDLIIDADSGRVSLTDATVDGDLDVRDSFGDVELKGINAKTLSARLSSGDLKTDDTVSDTLKLSNNFGKVKVNGASADSMTVDIASGDLTAKDVSTGGLSVDTNFGKVAFDRLLFTGRGNISASSGDVYLGLLMSEDDLSYELKTDAGSVMVDGSKFSGSVKNRSDSASADLYADCSFGSIRLDFLN